jgi:ADP-ribose pyrophosphatase
MDYFELVKSHPHLFVNHKDKLAIEIVLDKKVIEAWQASRIKELEQNNLPKSWAEIGVVLEDPYYITLRDLVRFPNGKMNGYTRILGTAGLKGGQGVVVLPVYKKKILIMKQYRHPTRSWEYEIPRGYGEPNTAPAQQAKNEVFEEVQGRIKKLHKLGVVKNDTGAVGFPVALFMAELESIGKPSADESIEKLNWLTVKEFEKWIASGKISDGFTIAAYTRAKLKGLI